MSVEVRTITVILSTMRSGSTLLKALLAEADDVSNLPEVNFQRFQGEGARQQIEQLDDAPIVVLKRPAWYNETRSYPRLPRVDGLRKIVLVRDAYETILSLKKMTFRHMHRHAGPANGPLLAYWYRIVNRLLAHANEAQTRLVRYEDLVARPLDVTKDLFQFLGSSAENGVDRYRRPVAYQWKWGQDDGGARINELRVLPAKTHQYEDHKLVEQIRSSEQVRQLRRCLGYSALPPA